jgi:hypothetical protein
MLHSRRYSSNATTDRAAGVSVPPARGQCGGSAARMRLCARGGCVVAARAAQCAVRLPEAAARGTARGKRAARIAESSMLLRVLREGLRGRRVCSGDEPKPG